MSDTQIESNPFDKSNMSRRSFLIKSAAFLAALTASSPIGGEVSIAQSPIESEKNLTPLKNLVTIDIGPQTATESIEQTSYPDNEQTIKSLLGENYISMPALLAEFVTSMPFDDKLLRKDILTKYPAVGLIRGSFSLLENHAKAVMEGHNKILELFDYTAKAQIIPLQDSISANDLDNATTDSLGNPMVKIRISSDLIRRDLASFPQQKIVQIPFQFGELELVSASKKQEFDFNEYQKNVRHEQTNRITYQPDPYTGRNAPFLMPETASDIIVEQHDGRTKIIAVDDNGNRIAELQPLTEEEYSMITKQRESSIVKKSIIVKDINDPVIEIRGAYSGSSANKNINELFELVHAYPDKLFIAAAGNNGDDLRGIRKTIETEWPENILIAGQWNSDKQKPLVNGSLINGADIYVDNASWNLPEGSSMSTAVLSAAASVLLESGYSPDRIKESLLSVCDEIEYTAYPQKWLEDASAEGEITTETARIFNMTRFRELVEKDNS